MADSLPAPVGVLLRALVAACFVGGGALALLDGRLVVAGLTYLAGYTVLAVAALAHGQRRRSVGLSLSGVGWASLALGYGADAGFGLVAAGVALLVVGTAAVAWPYLRGGDGTTESGT